MRWFKSRFGGYWFFLASTLAAWTLLRTALLLACARQAELSVVDVARLFGLGLVFDAATLCYLTLPLAVCLAILPDKWLRSRPSRWLLTAVYGLGIFALLFLIVAEWLFWDEFGHRFNFIAVDYLVYSHEVVGNIFESYPVKTLLASLAVMAAVVGYVARRPALAYLESTSALRQRWKPVLPVVAVVLAAQLFLDNTRAEFSRNAFANELAKNGLYSLIDAFYKNSLDYDSFYLAEDKDEVFRRARQEIATENSRYTSSGPVDITRRISYPGPERRCNVVLVMVESLSAKFLGEFGDTSAMTPYLDELCRSGLLFTNCYATGNRTVRGIEAVALSLPPTPGTSAVRYPDLGTVFSLPGVFAERGYDVAFLSPGYAYFDNLREFFSAQHARVIDRNDFAADEVTFSTVWGHCDEDLFRKTLKEADAAFARKAPFFHFALTVSNHRPYRYPEKIGIPAGAGRSGTVKYTDYAIGQFIDQARRKPWFDDTIFVIVADHCASSAGKADVLASNYHIPLLIYAPKWVPAGRYTRLCSQIDVGPTLLGLLQFSYQSKFFGKDLLRSNPQRALVATYEKLGLLTDSRLTVLDVKRECEAYAVHRDFAQTPSKPDPSLCSQALEYYQTASYLLKHHLLRECSPVEIADSEKPSAPVFAIAAGSGRSTMAKK